MLKTPILFLIFNRPETTVRVFSVIRGARPEQLFIAADGWREDKPGEKEKCLEARQSVLSMIDWPCEVVTLFRDKNLGCRQAVSSAIGWFFSQVEQGIILEDDCLPHQDFFYFCEEMLERYRYDERIMLISGDNFQFGRRRGQASYYFSHFTYIWGWASWRRAWRDYDVDLVDWPEFKKQKKLKNILHSPIQRYFWQRVFENIYQKKRDTWDHQVTYATLKHNRLCIVPNVNLVSNIGTNAGTHISGPRTPLAHLPTMPIGELIHPRYVLADQTADDYIFWKVFLNWQAVVSQLKFWR